MPTPATTGQLRTKISDMKIGDYIPVYVGNDGYGNVTFNNLGRVYSGQPEVPVTGFTSPFGAYTYLIKCAKGLLISDRVVWISVSWDILNSLKYIQGKPMTLKDENGTGTSYNFIVRSLTGGVAYADANGNKSTTDLGYGGFPVNNEWDKYIVNFPQELIQSGKTLDDVFHYTNVATWTQDTPSNGITFNNGGTGSSSNRISRGAGYGLTGLLSISSSISNVSNGFRPVFEYIES
jgi:hypothetical protein